MRARSHSLKTALGTVRSDRPPRRRPQPSLGAPSANPAWPVAIQRRYDELVAALGGVATMADGPTIWLTALALNEVDEHSGILQTEGSVYTSGRRALRRPHPAVQLRDAAWRRAFAGLRSLGLTPADRNRVETAEPPAMLNLARYR
jgi:hypothetical protein